MAAHWIGPLPVPSYLRWMLRQDDAESYRTVRQWLQLYQAARPGEHWVLKSPFHLPSMASLLAQWPEARVVITHRDPATATTSWCSYLEHLHGAVTRNPRRPDTASAAITLARTGIERTMAAREGAEDRFHDVHYADLVRDPVGTVRAIHERFGLGWREPHEAAMVASLARPRRPGGHRYRPEDYGTSTPELQEQFTAYIRRFAIPLD